MRALKTLKSNKGFSLVDVLVSVSISAGMILAFTNLSQHLASQQARSIAKASLYEISNDLLTQTYFPEGCRAVFAGQVLGLSASSAAVKVPAGGALRESGATIPNTNGLKLSNIRFEKILDPRVTLQNGRQIRTASLVLSGGQEPIGLVKGPQFRDVTSTHLMLEIDGAGVIRDCYNIASANAVAVATSVTASEVCASMGGSFDSRTSRCELNTSQICSGLGGTWTNGACHLPQQVASAPSTPSTPANPMGPSSGWRGGTGPASTPQTTTFGPAGRSNTDSVHASSLPNTN